MELTACQLQLLFIENEIKTQKKKKIILNSYNDLSQVAYFLIFFFTIYFSLSKIKKQPVMLTTQHPMKRVGGNSAYVIHNLETLGNTLLKQFIFGSGSSKITIRNKTISSSKCEANLSFTKHIESLCKKASQKGNAFSRLAPSLNFEQRKLIMNALVICHFLFCLVV